MALQNRRTYKDLGLDDFMSGAIKSSTSFTPVELANAIPASVLGSSKQLTNPNFTTTIALSATDSNTAAWAEGVINFTNGRTSETIVASNTGNITATTYIYYDEGKKGALQTTTDPKIAAGEHKYMLAIVEKNADTTKLCKITPINATGLTVSSIVATQISGDQLDVLAAKTGTLTVDETLTVGASNVVINGTEKYILINDGTNNRVLLGYDLNGF